MQQILIVGRLSLLIIFQLANNLIEIICLSSNIVTEMLFPCLSVFGHQPLKSTAKHLNSELNYEAIVQVLNRLI